MIYLGACLIAGIRLARQSQVNVRVVSTRTAIGESVDMARENYNPVLRKRKLVNVNTHESAVLRSKK